MAFNFDFFGPVVRRISDDKKFLYLTFDDGPTKSTPEVLKLLERVGVKATFFLVADRAKGQTGVINEMKKHGHGFGNHSTDHGYRAFFQGRQKMYDWMRTSEDLLSKEIGQDSVGFRPPAGVQTPELHWAAGQLQLPIILWKKRFFDTMVKWTPNKALNSLDKTESGDIILLHDGQSPERLPEFLLTLKIYIEEAKKRGFEFGVLNRKICNEALKINN